MKKAVVAAAVYMVIAGAEAEVFALDFRGTLGSYLSGLTSGVYTTEQNGVTLEITFSAGGTSGTDLFNLTGTGFGINNSESGDDTDALDDNEHMAINFNLAGTFQSIEFDRLTSAGITSGDQGRLDFSSGSTINFDGDSSNPLTVNEAFTASQLITLSQTAGGSGATWGFGLKTITVNVVPEPATFAMLGIGGLAFSVIRRASRK